MGKLLAVDLGLRIGLALYDAGSKELLWFRSHHLANKRSLARLAWATVRDIDDLVAVVAEGDRSLGQVWAKVAHKLGVPFHLVTPETWRAAMLLPRQRGRSHIAKSTAVDVAREIAEASGVSWRTNVRHDAAEAILIGRWATEHLLLGDEETRGDP